MLRVMLKQTVIATMLFAVLAAGWQLAERRDVSVQAAVALLQSAD